MDIVLAFVFPPKDIGVCFGIADDPCDPSDSLAPPQIGGPIFFDIAFADQVPKAKSFAVSHGAELDAQRQAAKCDACIDHLVKVDAIQRFQVGLSVIAIIGKFDEGRQRRRHTLRSLPHENIHFLLAQKCAFGQDVT